MNFEIKDTKDPKDSKPVSFKVKEKFKNQIFKLESTVLLLNIGNNILANDNEVLSYTTELIIININDKPAELSPSKVTEICIIDVNTIIRKSSLQLSCYVKPGGNLATVSTGVRQFKWSVTGSGSASIDDGLVTSGNYWDITLTVKVTATLNDGTPLTDSKDIIVTKF